MDLLQRLPKAALVTLVALLFFGGSVGFVMAATENQSIPEAMQLAAPQEGDLWSYDLTYAYIEGDDEDSGQDSVRLGWGSSTIVYDHDGMPHHVQPLLDFDYESAVYIDQSSRRAVANSWDYNDTNTRTSSYNPLPWPGNMVTAGLLVKESVINVTGSWIFYGDEPGPCGFYTDMHRGVVALDEPVTVHGDCLGWETGQDQTLFNAFETRTINGIPTVGFEAQDGFDFVRLWYNPAIPYPVGMEYKINELVIDLGFSDGDDDQFTLTLDADITLTSFLPGDKPWGLPSGELPPALTPVTTEPATAIGVDDSGVDHPFRLSEAYEGALTNLQYDGLRNYMAQRPDAIMVRAAMDIYEENNYDVYRWDFRMWAPNAQSLEVNAERRIAQSGTPQEILQSATGPEESYSSDGGFYIDFTTVQESRIPEESPNVAEAMMRFEQATGRAPTHYGFDYTCMLFCWGDDRVALDVAFHGESGTEPDLVTGEPGSMEAVRHVFVFNDQGHLISELRTDQEGTSRTRGLLGTDGSASPAAQADASIPGRSGGSVWSAPSAQTAAGLTFVAFLVGAAYWLWPTIKSVGFMGLFSRLQADQLLQHPVRSGIFDTVQAQPGIHYQGLVREVGKGRGVVEHHLRKLQQAGYVVSQSNGGHTCFFPKGIADHQVLAAVPVLKTEGASRVLRHVVQNAGTTVTDLAANLGIAKSTASHHVRRLRDAGLIDATGQLRVTPNARKALTLAA